MTQQVAVNDRGDVLILRGGSWTPTEVREDNAGRRVYFDGQGWQFLPSQNVQPSTVVDRALTGEGDLARGAEQLSAQIAQATDQNDPDRNPLLGPLRRFPAIRELTDRSLAAVPMETAPEVDARIGQREADYQQSRRLAGGDPNATDWARIGGRVAASVPAALAGGAPTSLTQSVVQGAGQGAALSAIDPVTQPGGDYWGAKRDQAVLGAATGAAGGGIAYGAGRLLTGAQNVDPNVRTLHDAGVRLTPGQAVGGATQRIEDSAQSLPIVGPQIRAARQASTESFNRTVANRVLQPLRQQVDDTAPVGRALVDDVYTRINDVYDAALPRVRPFGPDAQFRQDMSAVGQRFLTPSSRREFMSFLNDQVNSRIVASNGRLDGRTWKDIDEVLGRFYRTYGRSLEPADREMAGAALQAQRAYRELLGRTNATTAPEITAANAAFSRFVRMERASQSQGAVDGVFSAPQFSAAVRAADTSPRNARYARGEALMQDLSDPARAVLPSTVADSGTPERLLISQLLGGLATGGAAGLSGAGLLPAIGAGAAGAAAYSEPVRRALLAAMLARRPEIVQAAGQALIPAGAPLGVALGSLTLDPPPRPQQ